MQSTDQELVRRALRAALDRLEGTDAAAATQPPVVLVVLANTDAPPAVVNGAASQKRTEDSQTLNQSAPALHPGLERFASLDVGSPSSAPGRCFMEPDRVCVNSGACEMRGY